MPLKASSLSPVLEPLRRVTDLWLDLHSPIRAKAVEALTVSTDYTRDNIDRCIINAFSELTQNKIKSFIEFEGIHFKSRSKAIVLHIGAGNVFTSWLHGAVISLLLGHETWIKPSTHEPIFARLWQESVRMIDFTLADRIRIVPWHEDLLGQVQAIVAYGTDETLTQLRAKAPLNVIFVEFGHKLSVAVAFPDAIQPDQWSRWKERAIDDCSVFELNGCLSPQILFAGRNELIHWKLLSDHVKPAPELRPFTDLNDLLRNLTPYAGKLSCIGVAGSMHQLDAIRTQLNQLGVTRICELGQMQTPPLSWKNGEISLVDALKTLSISASAT